ncbi:unnamed protein product [[Candida] boidinii]|nr:unnamed protein product [[Candida] boidinii]GMF86710.1 unnamed protein product [[Candida] boidinii]
MMIKDSNNKTNSVFIDTTKLDNRKKKRKFNEHDDITNNGISDEEEDDDKNARVDMEPKIKEQTKLRDVVFEDPREAILKYSKK